MSGWQIVALIFAILLLLPGGCFLFFGVGLGVENSVGFLLLLPATLILGLAGILFGVAFRKRRQNGIPSS